MVRFRTGDIVSFTDEPCRCGRTSLRMLGVHGRLDDMLIIKGVNLFPSDVEAMARKDRDLTGEYRLVVDRVEHLDRLTIEIEHVRGYNGDDRALAQRFATPSQVADRRQRRRQRARARHAAARHPQGQAGRGPARRRVELTADMNQRPDFFADAYADRAGPAPVIRFERVSRVYPATKKSAAVTALRNVDISIFAGEIYGVIGRSGAGKSTLLRVDQRPGRAERRPRPGRRRRRHRRWRARRCGRCAAQIGMIFQHFNLLSSRTAFDNVALAAGTRRPATGRRSPRAWRVARARRAGRQARPLSGGTLGRAEAARRHRPRARHRAQRAAVRRGDLGARPGDDRGPSWPCCGDVNRSPASPSC